MRLKKASGNFELWTEGTFRAVVLVASSSDAVNRVTIRLFEVVGENAISHAKRLFDGLVEAYDKGIK